MAYTSKKPKRKFSITKKTRPLGIKIKGRNKK